jgi:hypothetical protein
MNIINTITRDKCLLSNSTDLETLYTFKNFPIYCGCVDLDSDVSEDLFSDMIWQKSLTSGNILDLLEKRGLIIIKDFLILLKRILIKMF